MIAGGEGIHYAHGCAFYELRDLIAENVGNDAVSQDAIAPYLYEIRILGKSGETVIYVGDHLIQSAEQTVAVPSVAHTRIVELIEKRRGQGVTTARIEPSIKRALARVQNPAYVEDNRCSAR